VIGNPEFQVSGINASRFIFCVNRWLSRPPVDVRFGSKADISACPCHVRFTPKSGHRNLAVKSDERCAGAIAALALGGTARQAQ